MILIGEKLNSSIPSVLAAMEEKSDAALLNMVRRQASCGADYLDVNTAVCRRGERQVMLELISLIREHTHCGIMIDTPSAEMAAQALQAAEGCRVILNSVTLTDRIDTLLPLAREAGAGIVGLPIRGDAIAQDAPSRAEDAFALAETLLEGGIAPNNIYIDVLAQALAVGSENANVALETIKSVRERYPGVHTLCGVSNISFGLPRRVEINRAFLAMAISAGMDAAILDVTSPAMQMTLHAALALAGKDECCMDYIAYIRENE